jgi:hypothetical protein
VFGDILIQREPSQTIYGAGFGFSVTQNVSAIDVRVVVQSDVAREVETLVGARLARSFGPYWSRLVHADTWTTAPQTLEFRYTPVPPYMTGPISATSAQETAFAIEFSFRGKDDTAKVGHIDGFSIRLVLADGTTTAWKTPSKVSGDSMDFGWNDWARLAAEDGSSASILSQPNIAATTLLRATGYGFSLPTQAVITGVELRPVGHQNADRSYFPRIARLVSGGASLGQNQANRIAWPNTTFPTIGGSTNAWQASLSPSTVTRTDFGVELSFFSELAAGNGSIYLDALPLRIWGCP